MRRRKNQDAFSLFAFQDIITSVTGIILLIALLLSLELVQREKITDTPGMQPVTAPQIPKDRVVKQRDRLREVEDRIAVLTMIPPTDLLKEIKKLGALVRKLEGEKVPLAPDIPKGRTEEDLKKVVADIERLEKELESLKSKKRIVYNKDPSEAKSAWLFDVGPKSLSVALVGEGESNSAKRFKSMSEAVKWAGLRDKNNEYFVLAVRPDSIPVYEVLIEKLREMGFDLGLDLISSDVEIINQPK